MLAFPYDTTQGRIVGGLHRVGIEPTVGYGRLTVYSHTRSSRWLEGRTPIPAIPHSTRLSRLPFRHLCMCVFFPDASPGFTQ